MTSNDEILNYIYRNRNLDLTRQNSGILAIALHREFDIDKFLFVEDAYDTNKIYHIGVEKNDIVYDASGLSSTHNLKKQAPEGSATVVSAIKASYGMYSYILKNTIPTLDFKDLA
jgi:hypothetical protein